MDGPLLEIFTLKQSNYGLGELLQIVIVYCGTVYRTLCLTNLEHALLGKRHAVLV